MIPGQYNIRVLYQATGTTTWTAVANNGTYINYNLIDVRNSGLTTGIELFTPLNLTTSYNMITGGAVTLNTQVKNFFTTNFYGTVQAALINVSTGAIFVVQTYTSEVINASSGNPYTFSNSHVTAPDGEYALAVQYQPSGSGPFMVVGSDYYLNPIIIHVHTNAGVTTVTSKDDISVYPNPANDIVNIVSAGTAIDHVSITDIEGREVVQFNVDKNQSVITVPVSNFSAGMYLVQLHTADGVVTRKIVITK